MLDKKQSLSFARNVDRICSFCCCCCYSIDKPRFVCNVSERWGEGASEACHWSTEGKFCMKRFIQSPDFLKKHRYMLHLNKLEGDAPDKPNTLTQGECLPIFSRLLVQVVTRVPGWTTMELWGGSTRPTTSTSTSWNRSVRLANARRESPLKVGRIDVLPTSWSDHWRNMLFHISWSIRHHFHCSVGSLVALNY